MAVWEDAARGRVHDVGVDLVVCAVGDQVEQDKIVPGIRKLGCCRSKHKLTKFGLNGVKAGLNVYKRLY